jgi:ketosteroid isomerase-like protein
MFETAEQAELAFYHAFEARDLEAMMEVWADDDSIVCIHPMGPRLSGRAAVRQSWEQIFSADNMLSFEVADSVETEDAELSVRCVLENIRHGEAGAQRSLMLATNVYRWGETGWRLCVHHASPGRLELETEAPVIH